MKKLGNIIVNSPNSKVDFWFNKCLSIYNIDKELPTLIIGLEKARELIPNFNILKKDYNNKMLWWTFGKRERSIDNEKDLEEFNSFCVERITDKLKYHFINPLEFDCYSKLKRYINFIENKRSKYYYIEDNKFIYLYDKDNREEHRFVYGISLNTFWLYGIKTKNIKKLISNNQNNIQIEHFNKIPTQIRKIIKEDIPKKLILTSYFS